MNQSDIEQKLQGLREEYKSNPDKRKIIKMQARLLQIALEKKEQKKTMLFE